MTEAGAPSHEPRPSLLPVLTAVVDGRWGRSLFGIVPDGAVRRRPSDLARLVVAAALLGLISARADLPGPLERALVDLVAVLPPALVDVARLLQSSATVAAAVLVVAAVAARRPRLLGALTLAGLVATGATAGLANLVDVADLGPVGARPVDGTSLAFPLLALGPSAAVLLVARPFVTRPARRVVEAVWWLSALSALVVVDGLPSAVVASLVLAWGAAALALLVVGSPGGLPTARQVTAALAELGVEAADLRLDPDQTWGHTTYVADDWSASPVGHRLVVEVVGRDSTDARLLRKLWRFVWYKDSGPVLALRRSAQVEHQALVLLLAARSGARVPDLVAVGVAGARADAVLAAVDPPGRRLAELEGAAVDEAVLDGAWRAVGALHAAGVAHGNLTGRRVVVDDEGAVGLVRFDRAEASAPRHRRSLDQVALLVATAAVVGAPRAAAAARRNVGDDGAADLLRYLEPAALPASARSRIEDPKALLGELRGQLTEHLGVEAPPPAELRRFSPGTVVLAGAFALGVYLLVGQLAGVAAMGDVFAGAVVGWVVLAALLAQVPPPAQAVAMTGAVAAALPLRPVAVVQYAQAFTGLVGGTAGNATLSIRFFQRQGLAPAVAVSSGVLTSVAGFAVQLVLIGLGLTLTGASFELGIEGWPDWLAPVAAAIAVVAVVVAVAPGLRRRLLDVAARQLRDAVDNVRAIVSSPRKAVTLFGGNLVSQVAFALVLGAALEAYGQSLPLLELIVVNSLASLVGGAVPVPGGMGVVEAGFIAGFTAAGVPEAEAVAATFTARMFTTYLPPVWGWVALQWLRRHDYV